VPPADISKVGRCVLKGLDTRVESAWLQRLKLKRDEVVSSFGLN
jgi:hypothetical protein